MYPPPRSFLTLHINNCFVNQLGSDVLVSSNKSYIQENNILVKLFSPYVTITGNTSFNLKDRQIKYL